MNSVIEDTYFFYRHCFQSNIGDKEKKKLIELTVKHANLSRFAALLPFKRVDDIGVERIVESKFNAIKMAIVATNLKQQAFIQNLAKILEAQSIQIVLLKSSALNGYIYIDGHCRGNSDIDILVPPKHQKRLEEILCNVAILHDKTDSEPFDGLYEKTWISKQDPTLFLDVHTDLTNPKLFNISTADILATTFSHPKYKSESIRVMSPEHNFIHAGLHILGDGYLPHHSLVDAIAISEKEKLNWECVEDTSKSWGCSLITKLLRTELKNTVAMNTELERSKRVPIRLNVGRKILAKHYPVKTLRRKVQQALLQIALVDSLSKVMTTQSHYVRLKLFGQ